MGRSSSPELFVLGTGQEDNIGDVVLRREIFDRLRKIGRLHILLGCPSADFLDGLRLDDSDVVYARLRDWHAAAWKSLSRGAVWFIDKPGELQLDAAVMQRQRRLLPLIVAIRVSRGQVLRVGMAMQSVESPYLRRLRRLFRPSTMVLWRDTASCEALKLGSVIPDWAFGWNKTAQTALNADRTDIVVTFRGDRDIPSEELLDTLATVAQAGSRRIVVVTQVRRDAGRSAHIATRLGAQIVDWPAGRSLAEHENVLREVYRRSALVVSDRLHALIMGMTEGAAPLCITDSPETKVARHFDAVGFQESAFSLDVAAANLDDVIERQINRRIEAVELAGAALNRLDDLTGQLMQRAVAGR